MRHYPSALALLFFACATHSSHHPQMGAKDFKNLPKVAMNDSNAKRDVAPSAPEVAKKSLPLTIEGITVTDGTLCTAVNDLTPVAASDRFSNDVGRVFLFSKVSMDHEPSENQHIRHVWYYKDRPIASVKLKAKSTQYRTYSSKSIPPAYRGNWRVEVVTQTNKKLESYSFFIE